MNTFDRYSYMSQITNSLYKQQEKILLEQLGDLVSKNLLVIESTQPVLIRHPDKDEIILEQAIKLTLRDKEYIESLEKENKELKERLETIKKALNGKQSVE